MIIKLCSITAGQDFGWTFLIINDQRPLMVAANYFEDVRLEIQIEVATGCVKALYPDATVLAQTVAADDVFAQFGSLEAGFELQTRTGPVTFDCEGGLLQADLDLGNASAFRRLMTTAFVDGPRGQKCNVCADCGSHVDQIIGCPDGAEICHRCFDAGGH
jgi:hypothetical protein